ncbi:hypothetical protein ACIRNY_11145 [Capnocytophaga canimorsus]|uniref:hypothetical protein n=1 Tax=Capnocytophaga canimorsus TaxID=28188 RepID=UPI00249C61FF|nr:hypothetical protein [Capnocytophaga canimorsus]WGU68286.1 hypothetical protein QIU19_13625 [Capnocytophaga canimorsus]WGU70612.1 hypothetical protein QIU18_00185 [Capnocytophaga canimorsus]
MKLFRHHSVEFQREIEENNSFVLDKSRKFNNTDKNKNKAEIFFYASTIEGAEAYANDNTKLFTYEAEGVKLLDLRKEEDRAMLKDVIADILIEQENVRKDIISDIERAIARESKKRVIARLEKVIKETEDAIITERNVVKDDKMLSGFTYWGQNASDYNRGVILKAEAMRLGYDGIIFQDFKNVVEIGLFKPAKLLNNKD